MQIFLRKQIYDLMINIVVLKQIYYIWLYRYTQKSYFGFQIYLSLILLNSTEKGHFMLEKICPPYVCIVLNCERFWVWSENINQDFFFLSLEQVTQ